jgi:pectate lyase
VPAAAAADGPDGFASVAALGRSVSRRLALGLSGTTGGVGGPTVTVDATDELLAAIDTVSARARRRPSPAAVSTFTARPM